MDATFTMALAAYNLISPARLFGGAAMNIRGKWHVIKTPGYDMATPGSYILFDAVEGGEFCLDCL